MAGRRSPTVAVNLGFPKHRRQALRGSYKRRGGEGTGGEGMGRGEEGGL